LVKRLMGDRPGGAAAEMQHPAAVGRRTAADGQGGQPGCAQVGDPAQVDDDVAHHSIPQAGSASGRRA
jgi:hypothetical protein